jgi:hypothetical protein
MRWQHRGGTRRCGGNTVEAPADAVATPWRHPPMRWQHRGGTWGFRVIRFRPGRRDRAKSGALVRPQRQTDSATARGIRPRVEVSHPRREQVVCHPFLRARRDGPRPGPGNRERSRSRAESTTAGYPPGGGRAARVGAGSLLSGPSRHRNVGGRVGLASLGHQADTRTQPIGC